MNDSKDSRDLLSEQEPIGTAADGYGVEFIRIYRARDSKRSSPVWAVVKYVAVYETRVQSNKGVKRDFDMLVEVKEVVQSIHAKETQAEQAVRKSKRMTK